jgi:eukaryotic translation initiation factor 2C
MIQVPSSRFGFPRLQYGKKETPLAEDHWNTKGKSFFKCRQMTFNVLVLVDGNMPDRDETAGAIQASFEGFCGPSRRGYSVATVNDGNRKPHILKDPKLTGQIRTGIDSARQKHGDINFLLLVLGKKDTEAYARFKDLADRTYGYHSICVVAAHVARVSPDKMGNIMLKANLKARGSNHTINGGVLSNIMADTLVLGADVTHPNSSSIQGCPSVAAIVGSVDAHAGRFLGSMRLNKNKQEVSSMCS